jgi:hypothetical protein
MPAARFPAGKLLLSAVAIIGVGAADPPDPTPIACNVAGQSYGSPSRMYCDMTKFGGGWGNFGLPGGGAWDPETGMPTGNFTQMVATTGGKEQMGGDFAVSGKCAQPCPDLSIKAQDSNLNVTDLEIAADGVSFTATVQFPDTPGAGNFVLKVVNNTGGLTQWEVRQPECGPKDVFTPTIIAHFKRCHTLRFMDWSATNGQPATQWSNRSQL